MINKIWGFFIIVGILYGILTGNIDLINKEIINSAKTSLDMFLTILPIITLWVGIMTIAKESGLLDKLSKMLAPLLSIIFPDIPKDHESLGFISSNIIVNIFGLGSAATPFGLKAMKSLQELNDKKDTATRSMVTFLVLNTSGMTLIPTTVISLRMFYNSLNPTEIIMTTIISTLASTTGGLLLDRFINRVKR
jgi:spore maturation protein A